MFYNNLKCSLKNTCGMNESQLKMTLLSMFTILFQGIGFYFIDNKGMKYKYFIFVILFGFIYNIMYYKTYL
jgi:hypothetical protein